MKTGTRCNHRKPNVVVAVDLRTAVVEVVDLQAGDKEEVGGRRDRHVAAGLRADEKEADALKLVGETVGLHVVDHHKTEVAEQRSSPT